jgi:DNA sulfur modification protein DndB
MELIALDEDDVVAIITRRLVDDYPLLHDFISLKKGNSLPKSDKTSLSTVTALYDGLDAYLREGPPKQWSDFKRMRPSDTNVDAYFKKATTFWDSLTASFAELQDLAESEPADHVAAKYRNETGGHLLFRPIGLTMVFRVCKLLTDDGESLQTVHKRLRKVPMRLSDSPWEGLIWDPVTRTMNTDSERQRVATHLLYHGLGGNLEKLKTDTSKLKDSIGGMLIRNPAEIELPRWN